MPRLVPLLLAIPLVVGYGLAEGRWTDRWAPSPELEQAPAKLARVPKDVGPWKGEDEEIDERTIRQGEIHAYAQRRYTHRSTGEQVTGLLLCGRAGPISVHRPEVCFGGAGYWLMAAAQREGVEAPALRGEAEFWRGKFHKPDAGLPEQMQLYWAWNVRGDWVAVDNPRLTFARERALYKLYVLRRLSRPDEPPEDSPVPAF